MNRTCEIVHFMEILAHRINACLEFADPKHYAKALALRDLIRKVAPSYDILVQTDVLVYDGQEILFNRMSDLHTDI